MLMDESLINYKPVLSAEEEIPAEEYNPYWSGVTHEREWRVLDEELCSSAN